MYINNIEPIQYYNAYKNHIGFGLIRKYSEVITVG